MYCVFNIKIVNKFGYLSATTTATHVLFVHQLQIKYMTGKLPGLNRIHIFRHFIPLHIWAVTLDTLSLTICMSPVSFLTHLAV